MKSTSFLSNSRKKASSGCRLAAHHRLAWGRSQPERRTRSTSVAKNLLLGLRVIEVFLAVLNSTFRLLGAPRRLFLRIAFYWIGRAVRKCLQNVVFCALFLSTCPVLRACRLLRYQPIEVRVSYSN